MSLCYECRDELPIPRPDTADCEHCGTFVGPVKTGADAAELQERPSNQLPATPIMMETDIWAGLGRHTSLIELQIDEFGDLPRVERFLTPEAARTLGTMLLLAAIAGSAYQDQSDLSLVLPTRLTFPYTCKAAGCSVPVENGALVCPAHTDHRCPAKVQQGWPAGRQCRNLVTPGQRCWRHV